MAPMWPFQKHRRPLKEAVIDLRWKSVNSDRNAFISVSCCLRRSSWRLEHKVFGSWSSHFFSKGAVDMLRVFEHAVGYMVELQGDATQVSGSDVCVIDCETVKPWPGCREMKTSWAAPVSLRADAGVSCLCARERNEHREDRQSEEYSDDGCCWEIAVTLWTDFLLTEKRQKEQERKRKETPERGIVLCDLFTHTDNSLICLSNLKVCLNNLLNAYIC